MRRLLLLLLSLLLASGTVAGSMAHAAEGASQPTPVAASEGRDWDGCAQTIAKAKKDSSSGDQQLPVSVHGCHGHHAGIPANVVSTPSETMRGTPHVQMLVTAVPPAAFTGTFRPPIA